MTGRQPSYAERAANAKRFHAETPELVLRAIRKAAGAQDDEYATHRRGGQLSAHNRWHVSGGVVSPTCGHCTGEFAEPTPNEELTTEERQALDGWLAPRLAILVERMAQAIERSREAS